MGFDYHASLVVAVPFSVDELRKLGDVTGHQCQRCNEFNACSPPSKVPRFCSLCGNKTAPVHAVEYSDAFRRMFGGLSKPLDKIFEKLLDEEPIRGKVQLLRLTPLENLEDCRQIALNGFGIVLGTASEYGPPNVAATINQLTAAADEVRNLARELGLRNTEPCVCSILDGG